MRSGSMFSVSSRTSTNTGTAPRLAYALAVVTNVNDGMITSSPGRRSSSRADISSAAVHDGVMSTLTAPVSPSSHSPQRRPNAPLPERCPESIAARMWSNSVPTTYGRLNGTLRSVRSPIRLILERYPQTPVVPEAENPTAPPELPIALSVVIPCYRDEHGMDAIYVRLGALFDDFDGACELVLVDDGSPDRTYERAVEGARAFRHRIRIVRLLRNFGQHPAVFAGLAHTRGRIVVTMDSDLQYPPEEVPKLVA